MTKQPISNKLQPWIEARRRYHLTDAQIQMARELGLNPKKFGKLANERQEPWKRPLGEFIEHIYFKQFGKTQPDRVMSMEQQLECKRLKREAAKKHAPEAPDQPSAQNSTTTRN
ncbi:MAG: hypothetical protein IT318_16205 [Anaerolineales bacterium]|nr:hypothetical protein [Anaerolineales bacterium]